MRKSVSAAMAAYNGEKYISSQIGSILDQLQDEDELVISVDPSSDATELILQDWMKKDTRIRCIPGPGQGVLANFENAIEQTRNEIVFLADQDDLWLDGKVNKVLAEFEDPKVQVVMHDAAIVDEDLKIRIPSFFEYRKVKTGVKENIIKNSYMGCCMAFRRSLIKEILPFPKKIPMHDQWIGLIGEMNGKNVLLKEKLLLYRRHGENETGLQHQGLMQMLKWRKDLVSELNLYKKRNGL